MSGRKPDGARVGYWVGRSVDDILAEIPERVALLERESGRADREHRGADAVALGDTADLLGMLGAWLAGFVEFTKSLQIDDEEDEP